MTATYDPNQWSHFMLQDSNCGNGYRDEVSQLQISP